MEQWFACGFTDQRGQDVRLTAAHLRQPAGFTRLVCFIHRGRREKGRKPGEETSPLLRWQATSRAKFCHEVASARGTDGSKYMCPSGSLASVPTLHSDYNRELHAHADREQINSDVLHTTARVNLLLVRGDHLKLSPNLWAFFQHLVNLNRLFIIFTCVEFYSLQCCSNNLWVDKMKPNILCFLHFPICAFAHFLFYFIANTVAYLWVWGKIGNLNKSPWTMRIYNFLLFFFFLQL